MSWQCRLVEHYSERIGDMWPVLPSAHENADEALSPDYVANRKDKRLPLMVQTPGGPWFMDGRSRSGDGWTITGEPPNLTVTPSINVIGSYHGWLTNGVLSDDTEGRTYPPQAEE